MTLWVKNSLNFLKARFPNKSEWSNQQPTSSCSNQLFSVVFQRLDNEFLTLARQECSLDGSTCLLGLVLNGQVTVANLGDSIATLVRKDGSFEQMNVEHTPMQSEERGRIEAANGMIINNRINGELSVTRAFGDLELKEYVISDPECRNHTLTYEDDLLILASDGIYRSYS